MNAEQLAMQILQNRYKDEIEFAGAANAKDIIKFIFEGSSPDEVVSKVSGGQPLTYIEAITVLAAVVAIIKDTYDLYRIVSTKLEARAAKSIVDDTWKKLTGE